MTKNNDVLHDNEIYALAFHRGHAAEVLVCHSFELIGDTPIYHNPRATALCDKEIIRDDIDLIHQPGMISSAHSPWSSPVEIETKMDGRPCLFVNYRALSLCIKPSRWFEINDERILNKFKESSVFTSLRLSQGFSSSNVGRM